MEEKRRVAFAAGSRADYGIVRNCLKFLDEDETIQLSILVTGALLSNDFGHQVDLIYKDGFKVDVEIDISIDSSSNVGVTHSMAIAIDKFGEYFGNNSYDLLIILGDRYEMLSVATAAAMNRVPILHLHGGEATYGNYDEFIRHSITKMSLYHFAATEEYKNRIIQMGEDKARVFNLGSLGAENCLVIDQKDVPDEVIRLKGKEYFVVLYHPETLTRISAAVQIDELLNALQYYLSNYQFVFLGSNADTYSNVIRDHVKNFVAYYDNCMYIENLPTSGYHYLLANSMGLIGNSSSGLIEAPSLKIYTINIGARQEGRVRGNSVIDIGCKFDEIIHAIDLVIKKKKDKENIVNPYFKPSAAINYYKNILNILNEIGNGANEHPKKFIDIR